MFFSSIKEINRLLKEVNSLWSKRISNYLKVINEKNWRSQNFNFLSLKNFSTGSFCEAPTHTDIIEFSNFLFNLKIKGLGPKLCVAFLLFNFEGNYDVFTHYVSVLPS